MDNYLLSQSLNWYLWLSTIPGSAGHFHWNLRKIFAEAPQRPLEMRRCPSKRVHEARGSLHLVFMITSCSGLVILLYSGHELAPGYMDLQHGLFSADVRSQMCIVDLC